MTNAWVDDDITTQDREYAGREHGGWFLLHQVSPRLGLLPADFRVLREWAAGLVGDSDRSGGHARSS